MQTNNATPEIDGYYCPEIKSRWKSYQYYKLILWAWMMNEVTTVFTPTELSHNGLYSFSAMQAAAVILVGMPLAYSEICLGQYSNCNLFSVWNFCPLFRNMGYASHYLIFIKSVYLLVLTSWHMIYVFYSILETPPWLNCKEFDDKCMVKRINVSVFQHCLEAQLLFEDDCGIKTASKCFYEREIGDNCTSKYTECYIPWKASASVCIICFSVYILSIKKENIIQIVVKFLAYYICAVSLVLFCISLATRGSWFASNINIKWSTYNFYSCISNVSRGFLSVGSGSGILIYLSRDVSFRSPATMTAISITLSSFFISFIFSLIAFNGIKTVSYFHGQEKNVIEIGDSLFFQIFGSMSEIMSYFDSLPIWTFVWFSAGFLCLYVNFWITFLFMSDSLLSCSKLARKYKKISTLALMTFIILCTLPFLCSDVTIILADATEIMQVLNSLLFSVSLYWIYGIHKHCVDITFMIGIKANYFWKLTWSLTPIFLSIILYRAGKVLTLRDSSKSYYIKSLHIFCDMFVLYIIMGIYTFIVIISIFSQVIKYCIRGNFREIIYPTKSWGPKDKILYKSRTMFLPKIMTREFLYRQVRLRGYRKK